MTENKQYSEITDALNIFIDVCIDALFRGGSQSVKEMVKEEEVEEEVGRGRGEVATEADLVGG